MKGVDLDMSRTRAELEEYIEELDDILSNGNGLNMEEVLSDLKKRGYSQGQIQEVICFVEDYID